MNEAQRRYRLVEEFIRAHGVDNELVLKSMGEVPRHLFVPEDLRGGAYEDIPLPIGYGQVISQPYLVGIMTQALNPKRNFKVLEIGTGSGYQAAVLARICSDVYTIENIAPLAETAMKVFDDLNLKNIHPLIGDGSLGWPEESPFDGIIVTAGAPEAPSALVHQLAVGGNLVIPIGNRDAQNLRCFHKNEDGSLTEEVFDWVRFVPLIGQQGWPE